MAIRIQPYPEDRVAAVRAFNARMRLGGIEFQFPEHARSKRLPPLPGRAIWEEYFLALEGDQVRGGYILMHQPFAFRGELRPLAAIRLPMSEGTIDRRYGLVGVQILQDALRREPLLIGTGMGSFREPIVRLIQSAGWDIRPVPFLFKVHRPFRFLRGIRYLRSSPARRLALDAMAWSGAGWAGLRALQCLRRRPAPGTAGVSAHLEEDFGDWADTLWSRCGNRYAMVAVRDREILSILYPPGGRFLRLRVMRGPETVGWAVLLDTPMSGHKQFGDLRLGSIIDGLCAPEDAALVVDRATRLLEQRGVDLIVSNQAHGAWVVALGRAGFIEGPSNYLVAVSKELSRLTGPLSVAVHEIHLNRGDGDGPIHL